MVHVALSLLLASLVSAQDENGWRTSESGLKHRIAAPKASKTRPGLVLLLHGKEGGVEPLESAFTDPLVKAGFAVATLLSSEAESPDDTSKGWPRGSDRNLVAVTREIALAYRVDRTRLYVIGMSPENPGWDLVFKNRQLYTGYVSVGGSPVGFVRGLQEQEKMELGAYFIVGEEDPGLLDTERTRDRAKREGLRDVVLEKYPGKGQVVPEGSVDGVLKWLVRERRKFVPGMSPDITWVKGKSLFQRTNMHYFHSENEKYRDGCQTVEWDWFADPEMTLRAQKMDCLRFVLESSANEARVLGMREPGVVFFDPESGKVLLRLTARKIQSMRKSADREKDPFKAYQKFKEGLTKQLNAVLK